MAFTPIIPENYDKAIPEYSLAKREIYFHFFNMITLYGEVQRHYFKTEGKIHFKNFNKLLSEISAFYMMVRNKMLKREFEKVRPVLEKLTFKGQAITWGEVKFAILELSRWMDEAGYMDVEISRTSPQEAATEWD